MQLRRSVLIPSIVVWNKKNISCTLHSLMVMPSTSNIKCYTCKKVRILTFILIKLKLLFPQSAEKKKNKRKKEKYQVRWENMTWLVKHLRRQQQIYNTGNIVNTILHTKAFFISEMVIDSKTKDKVGIYIISIHSNHICCRSENLGSTEHKITRFMTSDKLRFNLRVILYSLLNF